MILENQVIHEDNHLIVVNKKPSQLVQGDKTGDHSLDKLLKEYIKEKYNKPGDAYLGVIHRLDRPVSGVVVFAKTSKSLARMNNLFKEKEVDKTYWAITMKPPPREQDRLVNYLVRNPSKNKSFVSKTERAGSKEAVLNYKLIASSDRYYLLEIDLETGRHHQIRCQLAHIGCPVKGDLKYGAPRSNNDGGISLHARNISFIHPVKKEKLNIEAPPPPGDNLWEAFLNILNQQAKG